MASLAQDLQSFNSPKRGRGRPSHDSTTLGQINSDGYEVVASMTYQANDLADAVDYNAQEDMVRGKLGSILREQERVLIHMGQAGKLALEINRRAQKALALVDVLDAAQGLDKDAKPLSRAKKHNREAHAAGKRIIARTEPNLHVVGGLQ